MQGELGDLSEKAPDEDLDLLVLIEVEILVGPSIFVGKAQFETTAVRHRRVSWHPESELTEEAESPHELEAVSPEPH